MFKLIEVFADESLLPLQCSPEEEQRRSVRRERNKMAAARCRKRRMDHTNELLQVRHSGLKHSNDSCIVLIILYRTYYSDNKYCITSTRTNNCSNVDIVRKLNINFK